MTLNSPTVQSACLQNLTEPEAPDQCHNQNKETALLETPIQKLRQQLCLQVTPDEVMQ
jgi:hypothetical protein